MCVLGTPKTTLAYSVLTIRRVEVDAERIFVLQCPGAKEEGERGNSLLRWFAELQMTHTAFVLNDKQFKFSLGWKGCKQALCTAAAKKQKAQPRNPRKSPSVCLCPL